MGSLIKGTGTKFFRLTSKALPVALLVILLLTGSVLLCVSGVEASGFQELGDLNIGDKVVDPSWEWEHRTGNNYSGTGITKPVTWIVVAKNHYGAGSGVTLLSEELIGKHAFDNSTNRGSSWGTNHWGDSGTHNATRGLRPWLNSNGIHAGSGFYHAFSTGFKSSIVTITVPNKVWNTGASYNTLDRVFIPSTTELGDTVHTATYPIGTVYSHFSGAIDADRIAWLGGITWHYWTRSPNSINNHRMPRVDTTGAFLLDTVSVNFHGVRPALNLQSGTLVSAIQNAEGAYEILYPQAFGFYDHSAGQVYVKYDHTPGAADATYRLGPRGNNWQVRVGDFNGDNRETFGFYDHVDGRAYVKYDHNPGAADATYRLGPRGNNWKVLVGDFNGDGQDTFGFYDHADGRVYVKYDHTPGAADATYRLGPRGNNWEVRVGDFNSDGQDTFGFYDHADGRVYVKYDHTPGAADATYRLGPRGNNWKVFVGDFNGDGQDTFGFYDHAGGQVYAKYDHTPGAADATYRLGPRGNNWEVRVGDYNSNGIDTFGFYDRADGRVYVKYDHTPGAADATYRLGPRGNNWEVLVGSWK